MFKRKSNKDKDNFILQKSIPSLYGNNGMEPNLHGSYLLTHGLSHESRLQFDMKVHGTSCTSPTPNLSIIVWSLLPLNTQVSSYPPLTFRLFNKEKSLQEIWLFSTVEIVEKSTKNCRK